MKPKISVIVLIYNKEQYLLKCIDSILGQSYQDYEVLLVDDGSTDGSAAICDVYAQKNEKVRVFHKSNGGLCDARNYGMNHAQGEYLAFVDADDYLAADHLQNFNPKREADAYIQALTVVENGKEQSNSFDPITLDTSQSMGEFFKAVMPYSPIGFALRTTHSILYRKSSLRGLQFDPKVGCIEDYLFNVKFFQTIRSAIVVPGCGYYYVVDNAVLSKKTYEVNSYIDWNAQLQDEIEHLCCKWGCMDMFREIVRLRFQHIARTSFSNRDYWISDKYKIYKFLAYRLKQRGCENIPLDKKTMAIQKLPNSYASFLLILGLFLLRR